MAWNVELSVEADREIGKLDPQQAKRIFSFLSRLANLNAPRSLGKALHGPLGELWSYRVGDYRLISKIEDDRLLVLVLRVGHRSDVYG